MKNFIPLLIFFIISLTLNAQIPTEGLVAYFPFNGNTNDESGNNNNGVRFGATLISDRFGNPSSAFLFDGIDDYIEIEHSSSFNFNEQISISFWVIMESSAPYYYPHHIIEKYGAWGTGQRGSDIAWGVDSLDVHQAVWALNFQFNTLYHF
jgi:hypothetical protein